MTHKKSEEKKREAGYNMTRREGRENGKRRERDEWGEVSRAVRLGRGQRPAAAKRHGKRSDGGPRENVHSPRALVFCPLSPKLIHVGRELAGI
jgi:hypothetical protein